MRDLALPALATATTLLAVYAAGLIFVAQHVADRYTPVLYPVVVRRIGLVWLGLLALVTLASLAFTLIKTAAWTNICDAFLISSALLIVVLGLYWTFQSAADRSRILGMIRRLHDEDRIIALRDLTWNSVNRGDVTSTGFLLKSSQSGSQEQAALLDWMTQYSQILEQPWMREAILATFASGDFGGTAADVLRSAFNRLVSYCLDHELYESVNNITFAVVRSIALSPKFTSNHTRILFDLGFNLHYVGEEGSASDRSSQRAPEALEDARDLFLSKLTTLRRVVIADDDAFCVTNFCHLLERLAEAGIDPLHVASQVWDILEDSHNGELLEPDALESLANLIGACRHTKSKYFEDKELQESLDRYSVHLALYIVALGYKDQLARMMGNARFGHPKRMPYRLAMHGGISEDVYTLVARDLGYRN
jgi:hypothetical protein